MIIPKDAKAIRIASKVLGADIWLSLDPKFKFNEEGLARFELDEIPVMRDKTADQLRHIHQVKLIFKRALVRS